MANSNILIVDPQKMLSISAQFGESNNTVKNLTDQMLNIATTLKNTFSGEAATAFYGKVNGLQPDMQKLHKMIKEHTDDLQEMAKIYIEAEQRNQQTAQSLKVDQIL